jgi:hypothetical protein
MLNDQIKSFKLSLDIMENPSWVIDLEGSDCLCGAAIFVRKHLQKEGTLNHISYMSFRE